MKQIFIFPHAGGSEISYVSLQKKLAAKLTVNIIKYPGRGVRNAEPLPENIDALIEDCTNQIIAQEPRADYFILGHSFGALLAYECVYRLKEKNQLLPQKIFLSGRGAPSSEVQTPLKHLMTNTELVNYLSGIGGIPLELINNEDFLLFFLPIIRNDLKLNETYTVKQKELLDIPFIVLYGKEDKSIIYKNLRDWQQYSVHPIKLLALDGDHFFVLKNELLPKHILSYCNIN